MSRVHVTKGGRKKSFSLNDGKSGLLDRYVNLDTGQMYYTIGKQISGKAINPNGALGRKLLFLAKDLFDKASPPPQVKEKTQEEIALEGWIAEKKSLSRKKSVMDASAWSYYGSFLPF